MSVKVMGMVWDAWLPVNEKLVLLAMADHADHEGDNIYPSVRTLHEKTCLGMRQVQRAVHQLEERGVVRRIRFGGGRQTALWQIDLKALAALSTPVTHDTGDVHDTAAVSPATPHPCRTRHRSGVKSDNQNGRIRDGEKAETIRSVPDPSREPSRESTAAPRPRNALLDALAVLCFGSLDAFKLKGVPAQLQRAASDLRAQEEGVAADDVSAFQEWWKAEHWRGKRGERPKPHEVGAEFLLWRQRPASGEAQPVFDETTGRVTWQY